MSKELQELQNIITVLVQKVEVLTQENDDLKKRLSKYDTPKNSRNSSIPPSKDENRPKRKSLREKSTRKVGGQKGNKGNTLKQLDNPDVIKKYIPDYCNKCGEDLSEITAEFSGKRQVLDIPKIQINIVEHQTYRKFCTCGQQTQSSYPPEANAPVSYGNNIESLIGYFHARQYIPFKRMHEIFRDVFNIAISEGGIHFLLSKLVKKAQPAYELIKEKLQDTRLAVGSDETGIKVAANKHWAWTWQNKNATFITITDNRGQKSITDSFKDGFKKAVLVHDSMSFS